MDLVNEGIKLVEEAKRRDIVARLMGAIAFRIHCPQFGYLHDLLERKLTDVDIAARSNQKSKIISLFRELGMALDTQTLIAANRYIFKEGEFEVDVFFDRLEMCHIIDFRKRLDLDYPTIPLAELLLEKMQIVQINEKDIKDSIVLLREHPIGAGDNETLNVSYVAKLLSQDWGFYYTATTNLAKTRSSVEKYDRLQSGDVSDVQKKIDELQAAIDSEPKSVSWKMRAQIGPSKKWYRDVQEQRPVF